MMRATGSRGFSMIEVMVALIVIAIAVFGTAKMQGLVINATHNSANRSLAALQAASLAAAMRANPAYWASVTSPPPVNVATYSGSGIGISLHSSLSGLTKDCSTAVCTPAQMAAWDLKSWATSLNTILGVGSGANISCAAGSSTAPNTCTVEVDWQEKTVAANTTQRNAAAATQTYTLLVQP
jgi:type IV pilus assembly protein PilV